MAEHVGDEISKGIKDTARAAKSTAKAVKTVQKVAAKASTGNYIGAAADALKDETVIRVIAVILIVALLITAMAFFALPYTLFALIVHVGENIKAFFEGLGQDFEEDYYSGSNGRLGAALKGTLGIIKTWYNLDTNDEPGAIGEQDIPNEDDINVLSYQDAMTSVYERKLVACADKINTRMNIIAKAVEEDLSDNNSVLAQRFQARFNEEWGKYNDEETTIAVYDGVIIEILNSTISKEQAVQLLALYSSQVDNSYDEGDVTGLLKWLGYNGKLIGKIETLSTYWALLGEKLGLDFGEVNIPGTYVVMLGQNEDIGFEIDAWKGTFLPQYLIDEAIGLDQYYDDMTDEEALLQYRDKFGCSAADYMIILDCPDIDTIEATCDRVLKEETVEEINYVGFSWNIYEGERCPISYLPGTGEIRFSKSYDSSKYYESYSSALKMTVLKRRPDAGGTILYSASAKVKVVTEVKKTVTQYYISYHVPIQLTIRPVAETAYMTGMWSGYLPWQSGFSETAADTEDDPSTYVYESTNTDDEDSTSTSQSTEQLEEVDSGQSNQAA